MNFTKSVQSVFFRNFDDLYPRTGSRYEPKNFFIDTSQLYLCTKNISAHLSEPFGQGSRNKIGFFTEIPTFDLDSPSTLRPIILAGLYSLKEQTEYYKTT